MKKWTAAERNKVTQDWQYALEDYAIYAPMHLIKRYGPILLGVYLKPVYGGEHYVPVFHVHSLMISFPVISLACPISLKNAKDVQESISITRHNNELNHLVSAFHRQCPAAFKKSWTAADIQDLYTKTICHAVDYPIQLLSDSILLSVWCHDTLQYNQHIDQYKSMIEQWPERVQSRCGGAAGWENSIRSLSNKSVLESAVHAEIIKFKLTGLIDHTLSCSS